ncbi:MAG TPA: serine/threonine-protein kinase [Nannocystaceae bacterium]|nr:serine/threonine-protein kinase [Nannocystaceae bacterium]
MSGSPRTPTGLDALALVPGMRVGKYVVVRRLAVGGMAELYLVRAAGAAGFERAFALKRVRPLFAGDPGFIEMFLREARLAASLDHPNVARVLDVGEAMGEYFLVMELVHGRSLREVLSATSSRGGVELECALTIVHAAAGGLHHAHEARKPNGDPLEIIHRDVSPSNVLVSFTGEVKLVDFGIAKALADTCQTRGESVKGKIGYMSPEQCLGDTVDRRSDVFALGILLYEVTTGRRLFTGDSQFGVMNRTLLGHYERPTAVVPDYPPELEAVVVRALQREPDARYGTARELQDDLEQIARARGLALTARPVEAMMHATFGAPPEPAEELASIEAPTQHDAGTDAVPTVLEPRRPRKRAVAPWIAAVVAAGVGGAALLWAVGAPRSEASVAAPAITSAASTPVATREVAASPAPIVAPAPAVIARDVAPSETIASTPAPAPAPAKVAAPERSSTSKRSSRRARKPRASRSPNKPLFLDGM